MANKLYIGRGTGVFPLKTGKMLRVNKGEVYVLDAAVGDAHPDMFYTADQYVERVEAQGPRPSALKPRVEQTTAAPGEVREVKKPAARKPAAKKPATKK